MNVISYPSLEPNVGKKYATNPGSAYQYEAWVIFWIFVIILYIIFSISIIVYMRA